MEDKNGGASRDRTDDLIVANDALSQLSYSPTADGFTWFDFTSFPNEGTAGRKSRHRGIGNKFNCFAQSSLRISLEENLPSAEAILTIFCAPLTFPRLISPNSMAGIEHFNLT